VLTVLMFRPLAAAVGSAHPTPSALPATPSSRSRSWPIAAAVVASTIGAAPAAAAKGAALIALGIPCLLLVCAPGGAR
jgi:hypothetical protein